MRVELGLLVFLVFGAMRHDQPETRYVDLAQGQDFAAVGLVSAGRIGAGSAVLIAPAWAVTAAHVVEGISTSALTVSWGPETYLIETIVSHPSSDLALLRLSSHPAGTSPALLYRGTSELGQEAVVVGFGIAGNGLQTMGAIFASPESEIGVKRAGRNRVDEIDFEGDLLADFDHPRDSLYNMMGDALPLDLEYFPLPGDSGGGLYIKNGDRWELAGITISGKAPRRDLKGDGNPMNALAYGHIGKWARVSLFANWILQTSEESR